MSALHHGSKTTPASVISLLLQRGALLSQKDSKGRTAIHCAATSNTREVLSFLLDQGAEISETDNEGQTALHYAAMSNTINCIDFLVRKGLNVNSENDHEQNCVLLAVQDNTVEVFQYLMEQGGELSSQECDSNTALHKVAQHCSVQLLQHLIQQGANIHLRNAKGQIPLHRACHSGDVGMVKALLEAGSEVDVKDGRGLTPLHGAAKHNNVAAGRELLKASDKLVSSVDERGWTPLVTSFIYESDRFSKFLVSYYTDHSIQPDLKELKILVTAGISSPVLDELEKLFPKDYINLGSLLALYSFQSKVPLDLTVEALDVNEATDYQGQTIMHYACEFGLSRHVIFLVQCGADWNIPDKNGITPLEIAQAKSTLHTVSPSKTMSHMETLTIPDLLLNGTLGIARGHKEFAQIEASVCQLIRDIQSFFPDKFSFTPHLSGSVAENTKAGRMDEADFLCFLNIDNVTKFDIRETTSRSTGTRKSFVCIQCPAGTDQFGGEETRQLANKREYRYMDYDSVCADFKKYLYMAIEELRCKGPLPDNLYIYQLCKTDKVIPKLSFKWRSKDQPDLDISADVVPCIKFEEVEWSSWIHLGLQQTWNAAYTGEILAVPKDAGFDDMCRTHWRLSFSLLERNLILSAPAWCRYGYILLKSLRDNGPSVPSTVDDGSEISMSEDVPSIVLKTCFMFIIEEQKLNMQNTEQNLDSTLMVYVAEYLESIKKMSLDIIAKLRHFIQTDGAVPYFFNPTYDVLFGYTIVPGVNMNRLSIDGPRKQRKGRILDFCNFAEHCIVNDEVTMVIKQVADFSQSEDVQDASVLPLKKMKLTE